MAKRCFDIVCGAVGLVALFPLMATVAIAIRLLDPGPCIYRARRTGLNGTTFTMHKFRTMCVDQGPSPCRLTRPDDARLLPLGAVLRRLKLDELPELYDVVRGKMSLVGPRPEDPYYVERYYRDEDLLTLTVRPGLTSPASLYDYMHGDRLLAGGDVEEQYVKRLLPVRLALEALYVRESSFMYDLQILRRTLVMIAMVALGRKEFDELAELGRIMPQVASEPASARERA
jgi:lipopolysaccharide/colanic/teichoic acid biosynthesis glycosyltransferase